MVTRLSASDASFYHLEDTSTPMYVGTLSILRKPRNGLSYETLLATVERRLPQIPRYRQKVREVTLGLARPVWIDDRDFDVTYHIRRSALPSPGSDAQLHELIARLGSRPLDKSRPLWEMYLIEGLARNRIAIYTKSHQALVNGMTALEIGHVIADRTQKPPEFGEDIWIPAREPSDRQLVLGAVGEWIARPAEQIGAVRSAVTEVATNAGQLVEVGRRFVDVARTFARGTAPSSPLNTTVSRNRRFTVAGHRLEDYRLVRARYDCDVNDVLLTVVAGALRNWLMSRGEPVTATTTVRAMALNSASWRPFMRALMGEPVRINPGDTVVTRIPYRPAWLAHCQRGPRGRTCWRSREPGAGWPSDHQSTRCSQFPEAAPLHRRHAGLHQIERTPEMRRDRLIEVPGRHVLERAHFNDAGVVHQYVDRLVNARID